MCACVDACVKYHAHCRLSGVTESQSQILGQKIVKIDVFLNCLARGTCIPNMNNVPNVADNVSFQTNVHTGKRSRRCLFHIL